MLPWGSSTSIVYNPVNFNDLPFTKAISIAYLRESYHQSV